MFPDLEEKLCSAEVLQRWAPFSLVKRVALCEKEFGKKVSHSYLFQVYKRHNIGHRKAIEVKRQEYQRRFELDIERQQFALKLG